MKMTAAVLEECGKPLKLLDLEIPRLKKGQVLVKIAYSAICRSQLMEINGSRGHDQWLPHLLGHEASGVVADVGAEVKKVKAGDEVILTWIKSSGIEASTPEYSHKGRTINAGPITTFSTYTIVSENRVTLKPNGLSLDVAVLFGCALATGSGMALNEIQPRESDLILVLGLGGIGTGALLTLLALGHKNIYAVDKDDAKCGFAKSLGVNVIKFTSERAFLSSVKSFVPEGFDYCIEAGGSSRTIELGFETLNSSSGTLLFASHPPNEEHIKLKPHDLISGKNIKGSWGGAIEPDSDILRLSTLFKNSGAPLERLIQNKFELQQINQAVDLFSQGSIFRPILVM